MTLDYVKSYDFNHDMTDCEILIFQESFLKCDKETFSNIFLYLLDNFIHLNKSLSNINVKKIIKNNDVKQKLRSYYPTSKDIDKFINIR